MNLVRLEVTTTPVVGDDEIDAAIQLDDLKDHLRITGDMEDAHLERLAMAASAQVADELGRTLRVTVYKALFDGWPDGDFIQLPRPPILTDAMALAVVSPANSETPVLPLNTWSAVAGDAGGLVLRRGASWPDLSAAHVRTPVAVSYRAGYTSIPDHLLQLVRVTATDLYFNREGAAHHSNVRRRLLGLARPKRGGGVL
ncbi:MAG: phage gp6-like head-tail connector protein [Rhodospirillaceae bacterium]|nr:phage gp6-like head-tail connector protein [Rhodospirillaceae bacterium]